MNINSKPVMYSVEMANELRDSTNVGDYILFDKKEDFGERSYTVKGYVVAKYEHIFKLDDGCTYRWADYLRGKI